MTAREQQILVQLLKGLKRNSHRALVVRAAFLAAWLANRCRFRFRIRLIRRLDMVASPFVDWFEVTLLRYRDTIFSNYVHRFCGALARYQQTLA
jgi:hypothetical protein